jgi:cytochrome P450
MVYGAGSETTAATIATALACIALDPDAAVGIRQVHASAHQLAPPFVFVICFCIGGKTVVPRPVNLPCCFSSICKAPSARRVAARLLLLQKCHSRAVQELYAAGLTAIATPTSTTAAAARQPTLADLRRLPFLDAVFHEVLRLFPPFPGGAMRQLESPVTTGGITLPAGTVVSVPIWALQRSTLAWGSDAKVCCHDQDITHMLCGAAHTRTQVCKFLVAAAECDLHLV